MKILFLTHGFNSLTQRLYVELSDRGHDISVEFDINDQVTIEAANVFNPHIIIAPFLKRKIPDQVWQSYPCFIVHPGIVGDRGPSALDWSITNGEQRWGVTVLQANAELDAGPVWATCEFAMPLKKKSSIYRNELTEAAVQAVLKTIEVFEVTGERPPDQKQFLHKGKWQPLLRQSLRHINWRHDSSLCVLRKIHAADGFPGVLDNLFDKPVYLYNAFIEHRLTGKPGDVLAKRHGAICRATKDGAVWITHVKEFSQNQPAFKLPADKLFADEMQRLPESVIPAHANTEYSTWRDIKYSQQGAVGYLEFDFYNGAISTEQCGRLLDAIEYAKQQETNVIVLLGGEDFWCNGIHLNVIEASDSPADESLRNINAINDIVLSLINCQHQLVIAAMRGNAAAGGAFMALAADYVYARKGIILNPHYKSMGNLYGSEYWTYLLPLRIGEAQSAQLTQSRLPMGVQRALQIGFIDDYFGNDQKTFMQELKQRAENLSSSVDFKKLLAAKQMRREQHERQKPLQSYRDEELQKMLLNFYGFDSSYHVARFNFVTKVPHSWTPRFLAKHRSHALNNIAVKTPVIVD